MCFALSRLFTCLLACPSTCLYFWSLRLSVSSVCSCLCFFCSLFFFFLHVFACFLVHSSSFLFSQVRVGKLCIFGQQREGGAARGGNPLRHDQRERLRGQLFGPGKRTVIVICGPGGEGRREGGSCCCCCFHVYPSSKIESVVAGQRPQQLWSGRIPQTKKTRITTKIISLFHATTYVPKQHERFQKLIPIQTVPNISKRRVMYARLSGCKFLPSRETLP